MSFTTTTPTEDVYQYMNWFKDIPIRLQSYTFYVNLIKIDMYDFDVILGIN